VEDEFRPELQTESSGGGGSSGKTRIGADTPGESGEPARFVEQRLVARRIVSSARLHLNATKLRAARRFER
jgi:hypothetical protein